MDNGWWVVGRIWADETRHRYTQKHVLFQQEEEHNKSREVHATSFSACAARKIVVKEWDGHVYELHPLHAAREAEMKSHTRATHSHKKMTNGNLHVYE